MQSVKLIAILYKRELYFCETMNSRILAKIKFSRIFPNLQYLSGKSQGILILLKKKRNCTVSVMQLLHS